MIEPSGRRSTSVSNDSGFPLSASAAMSLRFPLCNGLVLSHELLEKRRGLPVHRTEDALILQYAFQNLRQADGVCIEQGAAAEAREAITSVPHDVDVGRSHRDAFLQDANAFVDQRQRATFDDLFVRVLALFHTELGGTRA